MVGPPEPYLTGWSVGSVPLLADAVLTVTSRNYGSWSLRGPRGGRARPVAGRRRRAGRAAAPLPLLPRAAPGPRRRRRLGHARDRRVPARTAARRGPPARRARGARALPVDLRRDALGLREPPLRPA